MKINQTAIPILFFIFSVAFQPPLANSETVKEIGHIGSVEERRILVSLKEQQVKLVERDKLLDQRELELKSLQTEVDNKLNELRVLRIEVKKLLSQKDTEEGKRVTQLSKMYEKMDSVKAATILSSLEDDLVTGILSGMKKKSAAKILNNMDKQKAAHLSVAFSTLKTN